MIGLSPPSLSGERSVPFATHSLAMTTTLPSPSRSISNLPFGTHNSHTAHRFFIVALTGTCLVYSLTVTRSPPVWQDEVQIVDYGRTLLAGADRSYGVNWSNAARPVYPLAWIGCVIAELGYRIADSGNLGPRCITILGGVAAAIALRAWLVIKGMSPWASTAAACTLFWDPLVVASYRGGRVDSWCIASMLAACWCIRRATRSSLTPSFPIVAGACTAISGLIWPSAILLLPLLLFEIVTSSMETDRTTPPRMLFASLRLLAIRLATVGILTCFFIALLLLPVASRLPDMWMDCREGVTSVVTQEQGRILSNMWRLARAFLLSPFLPILAITGTVACGPRAWFLPLLATTCGVIGTRAYGHRAVYLVPMFAYGLALLLDRLTLPAASSRRRLLAFLIAILVLGWASTISVVIRTGNSLLDWDRRDPLVAASVIDTLAGDPGTTVLLSSWSLYYPIRDRKWHYWGPYDLRSPELTAGSLDVDYVIHDLSMGTHPLDASLRESGYRKHIVETSGSGPFRSRVSHATQAYGPYVIYSRND